MLKLLVSQVNYVFTLKLYKVAQPLRNLQQILIISIIHSVLIQLGWIFRMKCSLDRGKLHQQDWTGGEKTCRRLKSSLESVLRRVQD